VAPVVFTDYRESFPADLAGEAAAMDPRHELRPKLEAMIEDAHRMLGSAAEMQRKLADLTARTKSEDGYVVTTVDARGRLVELRLDPRIYRAPNAGALAATILETMRRAVEKVEQDSTRILAEYLPADMDIEAFTNIDFERYAARHNDTGRGDR
jgi:DNA-binding protein YbaB